MNTWKKEKNGLIKSPWSEELIGKPIIEMDEARVMPLYMLGADLKMEIPPLGDAAMNLMITISHLKENNKLEIRGRMRFEDTGRKTIFGAKKEFTLNEFQAAKDHVGELYKTMVDEMFLKEHTPKWELQFAINESSDNIMKKINESNHFNITTIQK